MITSSLRRLRPAARPVFRRLCALCVLTAAATAAACGEDPDEDQRHPEEVRGTLVSVTPLAQLEPAQVGAYLQTFDFDPSRVTFGVEAHRIVYRTIDTAGRPTVASALVALPRTRPNRLSVVSWMHGTTVYRHEVASENDESSDRAAAYQFAAAGFAVCAPDYLGLGASPGFHPFDHFESAATAALDAVRATRALVAREGGQLDKEVLISGFSQGGPSGMAFGRLLQSGADPNLGLGGVGLISGPFDVSGTFATGLTGNINLATAYLTYLMVAWNRLHHFYDSPTDAFRAPYAGMVETLFDNEHRPEEVLGSLPDSLDEMFTPQFLAAMRNPAGSLKEALRVADTTCDWAPRAPVRLYGASGDKDVPIVNSTRCQEKLKTQGVEAEVIDLGDVDHGTAGTLGVARVLGQFLDSRK